MDVVPKAVWVIIATGLRQEVVAHQGGDLLLSIMMTIKPALGRIDPLVQQTHPNPCHHEDLPLNEVAAGVAQAPREIVLVVDPFPSVTHQSQEIEIALVLQRGRLAATHRLVVLVSIPLPSSLHLRLHLAIV